MSCDHHVTHQIGPKEACGCPFDPLFPSVNKDCDRFCDQPRKACIKHYCWEKLRRAEIDQEKLNLVSAVETVRQCRQLYIDSIRKCRIRQQRIIG